MSFVIELTNLIREKPKWQNSVENKLQSKNKLPIHHIASLEYGNHVPHKLSAQIFSDTHLAIPSQYHNTSDKSIEYKGKRIKVPKGADPSRLACIKALIQINKDLIENQPDILIFNGDTFEILNSCYRDSKQGFIPFDADGSLVDIERHRKVFEEILDSNPKYIEELAKFLSVNKERRVVFVTGNHDHLLSVDGDLRDLIYKKIKSIYEDLDTEQIIFANAIQIPDLELHAEHGHMFEPKSHCSIGGATECDVLSLAAEEIPNAVIKQLETIKIKKNGNKKKIIDKLKSNIDDFIFLDRIPPFIEYLNKCFKLAIKDLDPDAKTKKKLQTITTKIMQQIYDHFDAQGIASLYKAVLKKKVKTWSEYFSKKIVKSLIRPVVINSTNLQKGFINYINKQRDKKCDNKTQKTEATRIHGLMNNIKHFFFGHTHNKESTDLIYGAKFYNTGVATRIIKTQHDPTKEKGKQWSFEHKPHDGTSVIVSKADGVVSTRTIDLDHYLLHRDRANVA